MAAETREKGYKGLVLAAGLWYTLYVRIPKPNSPKGWDAL